MRFELNLTPGTRVTCIDHAVGAVLDKALTQDPNSLTGRALRLAIETGKKALAALPADLKKEGSLGPLGHIELELKVRKQNNPDGQ